MIHYHGGPITPNEAARQVWSGRHALVSFARTDQIGLAAEVAQSFVLDNGAFSAWRTGYEFDFDGYSRFVDDWCRHPGFDWCLIPDVIDGDEQANDELLHRWVEHGPRTASVPVFHMHESIDRLIRLADEWDRVALGSSGQWETPGTSAWWGRMAEIMNAICDSQGRPMTRLHGLRMLNPAIFRYLPLSSADSSAIARSIGIDSKWKGTYTPPDKASRGLIMAARIESEQSAPLWVAQPEQHGLFA